MSSGGMVGVVMSCIGLGGEYPITSVVMLVASAVMARMLVQAWKAMSDAHSVAANVRSNFAELKSLVEEHRALMPATESAYMSLAEDRAAKAKEAAKAPAYFAALPGQKEVRTIEKRRRPSLLKRLMSRTPTSSGKPGGQRSSMSPDTPLTPSGGATPSLSARKSRKGLATLVAQSLLKEEEREDLKEMVVALKSRVPDLPNNMIIGDDADATYERFLAARGGDVMAAEAMLRNTLAWREKFAIESILRRPYDLGKLQAYWKYLPHTYFGHDKDSRPVYWNRVGAAQWKLLMKRCTADDLAHFHIIMMEYVNKTLMQEASRMKGGTQDQAVYILDISGFSLFDIVSTPVVDFLKGLTSLLQDHYPQQLAAAVVINAPASFSTAWSVVDMLGMDPNTKSKFRVVSVGQTHGALREMIDDKHIPTFLGGEGELEGDLFNLAGGEELSKGTAKGTALTSFQTRLINHTLVPSD